MTITLQTVQRLRPEGQWGFYLFPECYNYNGQRKCDRATRIANDRYIFLLLFPVLIKLSKPKVLLDSTCYTGNRISVFRFYRPAMPVFDFIKSN